MFYLSLLMVCHSRANQKPYVINFFRDKYHAANKNWSIGQDEKGTMYFGNDIGLLESDGMEWKLYPMPNSPIVRALAVESQNYLHRRFRRVRTMGQRFFRETKIHIFKRTITPQELNQ